MLKKIRLIEPGNYAPYKKSIMNLLGVRGLFIVGAEHDTVGIGEKIAKYNRLKIEFGDQPGFYLDMAQHLFETGYRKEALSVLFSAADIAGGNQQILKAIGYTLETWKQFDEAINLYRELLSANENDLQTYRDLALTYYQNGNYQMAVDVFYQGITKLQDNYENVNGTMKSMMLQEMNAIIALHKDILDLSKINKQLIRPLAIDLRITFDCNNRNLYNSISIVEPGNKTCSYSKPESANGGLLTQDGYYYGYNDTPAEYQIKNAKEGKYKLKVNYSGYNGYYNGVRIPTVIKITTFKNLGKAGQAIQVENVIMDNQYGEVEIGEVKW